MECQRNGRSGSVCPAMLHTPARARRVGAIPGLCWRSWPRPCVSSSWLTRAWPATSRSSALPTAMLPSSLSACATVVGRGPVLLSLLLATLSWAEIMMIRSSRFASPWTSWSLKQLRRGSSRRLVTSRGAPSNASRARQYSRGVLVRWLGQRRWGDRLRPRERCAVCEGCKGGKRPCQWVHGRARFQEVGQLLGPFTTSRSSRWQRAP